jgi:phosphinothricin acetyltransferase
MTPLPDPDAAPAPAIAVRDAAAADMPAIREIYAREVLQGLATFEKSPPTVAEMQARRDAIVRGGTPYLVAEIGGRIAGYSYASAYRPRPAYRHTIEDSVYVAEDMQRRGVGRALLAGLIARCEQGPWRQMIAVIGDSENGGSIGLHAGHGFRHAGTLEAVGYKLGRWVDTVVMQRPLGPGSAAPPRDGLSPTGVSR